MTNSAPSSTSVLRVGVIGCGNISDTYFGTATLFPGIDIVACADLNPAAAQAKAQAHNIKALSVEALLQDDAIDCVLNLTIPAAHAEVSLAAIAQGKHVYSEKPLATSMADGRAVLAAASARGVRVGGAPDTVLGAGVQTARRLIDSGQTGAIISGVATCFSIGMEDWHPNPGFFFRPGGGPVLDMGPYYVTALVTLLGPVARVRATATAGRATRIVTAEGPQKGQAIAVEIPTTVNALLSFAGGAEIAMLMSWDVRKSSLPFLELHGVDASLSLPDPNWFGGGIEIATSPRARHVHVLDDAPLGRPNKTYPGEPPVADYRGIGLAEMASAIRSDTDHRCSGKLALHALEVMLGINQAAAEGNTIAITTEVAQPAALTDAEVQALLGA